MVAKKILFICKHNVFRSKFAEEYMKKIGESNLEISSAGVIQSKTIPCKQSQLDAAKEFGVEIEFASKTLSIELLREQDLIIVIASDVPKELFDNPIYEADKKFKFWNIDDVQDGYEPTFEDAKNVLTKIAQKVDELNNELKEA